MFTEYQHDGTYLDKTLELLFTNNEPEDIAQRLGSFQFQTDILSIPLYALDEVQCKIYIMCMCKYLHSSGSMLNVQDES